MELLKQLYLQHFGTLPVKTEPLKGAGSNRRYVRFTSREGTTVIGVVGTNAEENQAFVRLSAHFALAGLNVPRVLAVSPDGLRYLQDDLGRRSLFDALSEGRAAAGHYNEHEKQLLLRTMRSLPHLQVDGAKGLDWSVCYPQQSFDRMGVMFDLNYFKYCFLKLVGLEFHEVRLQQDFERLADALLEDEGEFFLYRDFQARNVMLNDNDKPFFIDFQGGRKGPLYYDVASFLWQASARYDSELRCELIAAYYDELKQLCHVPSLSLFNSRLQLFVLFRTLQVLGAYGYRGYYERKPHFINSIPPAIENVRQLVHNGVSDSFPYLKTLLCNLVEYFSAPARQPSVSAQSHTAAPKAHAHAVSVPQLTVRVFSFSYKKGIPDDESGNGGGYVFDCRSTHNPGRYEPYKQLTGLDEPVIRFLEDDGEIITFLDSVYLLADKHVERYIERGFSSLMFAFGCTGGQHRSVYCAQHLAEHIHRKYGITVRLCHREQGISQTFDSE